MNNFQRSANLAGKSPPHLTREDLSRSAADTGLRMPARRLSSALQTAISSSDSGLSGARAGGENTGSASYAACCKGGAQAVKPLLIYLWSVALTPLYCYLLLSTLFYSVLYRLWVMHLAREGRPGIKVEEIVDIARAAGRVILDVYKEDREVMYNFGFVCCTRPRRRDF